MSAVEPLQDPVVRVMSRDDIEAIVAIEQRAYNFPWTAQIFIDCLRVGYGCRVIEQRSTVLAYGIMSVGANEAHILNLCVDGRLRRQGLGQMMLLHLINEAEVQQVHTVFLEVRPSNIAARRLYEKTGFNEIGIRRAYYPGTKGREDAVILARALITRVFYT